MRYAAFIRSLNVGTFNRITMPKLLALVEKAGIDGATSHLATGNLVFQSRLSPEPIAVALEQAFTKAGLKNAFTVVRTIDALEKLKSPFRGEPTDDERRCVTLLRTPSKERLSSTQLKGVELLGQTDEVVFTRFFKGSTVPNPNDLIEKALKTRATTRFWNVVKDVASLGGR